MALISVRTMWPYWPLILISFFIVRALYRKYFHPLRKVPGPFLASTTNLWRLALFLRGRQHHEYVALFQKYGPLVRLGPNTVILNDSAYFAEYFGYDRSPWWNAFKGSVTHVNHANISNIKEH